MSEFKKYFTENNWMLMMSNPVLVKILYNNEYKSCYYYPFTLFLDKIPSLRRQSVITNESIILYLPTKEIINNILLKGWNELIRWSLDFHDEYLWIHMLYNNVNNDKKYIECYFNADSTIMSLHELRSSYDIGLFFDSLHYLLIEEGIIDYNSDDDDDDRSDTLSFYWEYYSLLEESIDNSNFPPIPDKSAGDLIPWFHISKIYQEITESEEPLSDEELKLLIEEIYPNNINGSIPYDIVKAYFVIFYFFKRYIEEIEESNKMNILDKILENNLQELNKMAVICYPDRYDFICQKKKNQYYYIIWILSKWFPENFRDKENIIYNVVKIFSKPELKPKDNITIFCDKISETPNNIYAKYC